jgi:hypothetical protein
VKFRALRHEAQRREERHQARLTASKGNVESATGPVGGSSSQ